MLECRLIFRKLQHVFKSLSIILISLMVNSDTSRTKTINIKTLKPNSSREMSTNIFNPRKTRLKNKKIYPLCRNWSKTKPLWAMNLIDSRSIPQR